MSQNYFNLDSLQHHLLVATPQLDDSPFERAVIYVCNHDDEGTMGVVVNQPLPKVSFKDITESMGIELARPEHLPIIYKGGPVEESRGFVIHSDDYSSDASIFTGGHVLMSATADIVSDIAAGHGPQKVNFCLGYAGWSPGQLEGEIARDSWLVLPADEELIFNTPVNQRYELAQDKLGIHDFTQFHDLAGRA